MPPGIKQNNNLLHLTLDVWQDQVFMNDVSYPAGHFAAEILNIKEDSLQLLLSKGGEVSHYAERIDSLSDCAKAPERVMRSSLSSSRELMFSFSKTTAMPKALRVRV